MSINASEVLYYPNFHPNALPSIKRSLLLYARVNAISPTATPLIGSILSEPSEMQLYEVSDKGALAEYYDLFSGEQAVGMISDSEIIQSHRHEFQAALAEDLNDENVLAWEKRWKANHEGKELNWFVAPHYFGREIPNFGNPNYEIQEFGTDKFGTLLRVPFLVGMSLGLSEALWAAVDKGYTLFTDDNASEQFLMLRLGRGWKHFSQDPTLQDAFGLEPEFAGQYAVASLGTWTLQCKMPELIKEAANMSVSDIIELREQSDQRDALASFRSGLADLVQSSGIWEGKTFQDFENAAYKLYRQSILPAFEELEGRRVVSVRDVFGALDWKDALHTTVKSAPTLFVSAAVLGGTAPLLGFPAVAPAGLLALGCGLAGQFIHDVLERIGDRLKERRNAQFLSYPMNLQSAMNRRLGCT